MIYISAYTGRPVVCQNAVGLARGVCLALVLRGHAGPHVRQRDRLRLLLGPLQQRLALLWTHIRPHHRHIT